MKMSRLFFVISMVMTTLLFSTNAQAVEKRLVYIASDLRIPFWDIMRRGIESRAEALGFKVVTMSADNNARQELENTSRAIREKVDGIILSPTNSSTAVTILRLAKAANIPVVISDIGTDGGEYVSYIASDNRVGAYQIGKVLAKAMKAHQWEKGTVGIIAIPQKRANGKARTDGFMQAMNESGIKGAGIRQQVDFSYKETYQFARELITSNPQLRALWLQGSDRYQGALDAIADVGKKDQILLICFDAEPEFIDMIQKQTIVGAAMQQPYLMGEEAVNTMEVHLKGHPVKKNTLLPILPISNDNISILLPTIRRNVLGLSTAYDKEPR